MVLKKTTLSRRIKNYNLNKNFRRTMFSYLGSLFRGTGVAVTRNSPAVTAAAETLSAIKVPNLPLTKEDSRKLDAIKSQQLDQVETVFSDPEFLANIKKDGGLAVFCQVLIANKKVKKKHIEEGHQRYLEDQKNKSNSSENSDPSTDLTQTQAPLNPGLLRRGVDDASKVGSVLSGLDSSTARKAGQAATELGDKANEATSNAADALADALNKAADSGLL
jgi:hypothetical protein